MSSDYISGQDSAIGALWVFGFLFTASLIMYLDGLARTMIYDETGIESKALLALRRKRFIPWQEIYHVRFKFGEIIVRTATSRVVIQGFYRGLEDFKERLKQECPDVEIEEDD